MQQEHTQEALKHRSSERSEAMLSRAEAVIPAGVSSPVRAFRSVGGTPRFIDRGKGARIWDIDGNEYIDFCMSWGPLILGHAPAAVVKAISEVSRKGTSFGAATPLEVELAERVTQWAPWVERIRFVNSGTEAVMSAVRLARGFTGRDKIIKFAGCYHGHADYLLVSGGSGLATFGTPSSAGVPGSFTEHTIVIDYNDTESVTRAMSEFRDQIACIIVEPVAANNGLIQPAAEFLPALRRACDVSDALLIFDEVITGFRLGRGGAAEKYGVRPDLVTFGKVIGGGLPVGAFGGRREIMERIAPLGDVYQAGTLSGNPLAMAAGLAALAEIERGDAHRVLEQRSKHFGNALRHEVELSQFDVQLIQCGSIFWLYFSGGEAPLKASEIDVAASARYSEFFHAALNRGVYLAPSAYEVGFISTAHDEETLAIAAKRIGEAIREAQ